MTQRFFSIAGASKHLPGRSFASFIGVAGFLTFISHYLPFVHIGLA